MIIEEIRNRLFEMQDTGYREFHSALVPNIDKETIIGVRTPQLRKYAKELAKREDIEDFLNALPHEYYEERNLHSFIICEIRDYEKALERVEEFLPYVDNWAICDQLVPKAFKKYPERIRSEIDRWTASDKAYTKRFGIEMAMNFFLDERYDESFPEKISKIRSDEYYVRMMVAWYFATALAKQWESAVKYIENGCLDEWTHNKTIRKAIESYRITDEQKAYLRTLKIQTK